MTEFMEYGFVALILALAYFAYSMWRCKMFSCLVSNYIIILLCLWFSLSLESLIAFLEVHALTPWILGISWGSIAGLFIQAKLTLSLMLYGACIAWVYKRSRLSVCEFGNNYLEQIRVLFLIGMTVIGFLLWLEIVGLGSRILSLEWLYQTISSLVNYPSLFNFVTFTPLILLVHAGLTLLLSIHSKTHGTIHHEEDEEDEENELSDEELLKELE